MSEKQAPHDPIEEDEDDEIEVERPEYRWRPARCRAS